MSLRCDTGRKAAPYARFGIRELWVIDAVAMTARAYRSPSPESYSDVSDHAAPGEYALRLNDLDLDAF